MTNFSNSQDFHAENMEMVRALTIDKHRYQDAYREKAATTLKQRGISLEAFKNRIHVRINDETPEDLTIAQGLEKLQKPKTTGDVIFLENCIEETIICEKERKFWILHHFSEEAHQASYTVSGIDILLKAVSAFLKLENWKTWLVDEYNLDDWEFFTKSQSLGSIKDLTMSLDDAGIPYSIRSLVLARFNAIFGTYNDEWPIHVFVPSEHKKAANKLLKDFYRKIDDLYAQAVNYAKKNMADEELETYSKLAHLAPHDKRIFYNTGVILMARQQYQHAAAAFVNAAESADPAIVRDAAEQLKVAITHFQPDKKTLHTLASIANMEEAEQEAQQYYLQILELDNTDELAHLNLGYFYYQSEQANAQAIHHFEKYLALTKDVEDQKIVTDIIASLHS